jgi:hypothetical protein
LLKGSPHRQRKETDDDVSLGPLLFAVEDRPHPKIMFFGTETVLYFRKLDVGIQEGFRVTFGPVGPQDITATGFQRPLPPPGTTA